MGKFLRFQDIITMDIPCSLPSELNACFPTHSIKMKELLKNRVLFWQPMWTVHYLHHNYTLPHAHLLS